jgi:tRNA A37 threonylcarbamoyladenosine synthetase subunit TsaC/SUA5/YrdC
MNNAWSWGNKEASRGELRSPSPFRFSIQDPHQRDLAAHLLTENKVGVIAFNGIYGLFTSVDDQTANLRIIHIKNRPQEKNLVVVTPPEHLDEHVDFSQAYYSQEQVAALQTSVHALGLILPAGQHAPNHILVPTDTQATVLSIWTEYEPFRLLMTRFREIGGRSLAGTSANKGGHPTHIEKEEVWEEFKTDVDFFLEADFSHLPDVRRKSTTVLDLTQPQPRLHRLGNVPREEIQEALLTHGFPDLHSDANTIVVKARRQMP